MGVPNSAVKNCVIWGNHSSTQYPDLTYAVVNVGGKEVKAREAIKDDNWVKNDFVKVLLASLHDTFVLRHYCTKINILMIYVRFGKCMLMRRFVLVDRSAERGCRDQGPQAVQCHVSRQSHRGPRT